MAVLVQVTGDPGSGKSRSVKNLNPDTTFIDDADGKGLSYTGWRLDYNKERKNYSKTSNLEDVKKLLTRISENQPHIKDVIIDTVSTIASDMQIYDMKKASHDTWREFATDIYDLYSMASSLREDLIIYFMAHKMLVSKEGQAPVYTTKLPGKMLTKLNMNAKLNYNLYTEVVALPGLQPTYSFVTQTDGTSEARSTEGVLPLKMPNDLAEVSRLIREKDLMEVPTSTTQQ